MSSSEEKDLLLSQWVDGELPADQADQVLADALDNVELREQLKAMLRLRQVLGRWTRQEPPQNIALDATAHLPGSSKIAIKHVTDGNHPFGSFRTLSGLAAAAILGGVLVAGGFFLEGLYRAASSPVTVAVRPVTVVTPEQRQEIARAFALHESVSGPLSWYASDDATILVAPAKKGETLRKPIAVVLRFARDASCAVGSVVPPKTYIIVCRNDAPETIELPELPASIIAKKLRLRLVSTEINGQISLQYALATNGSGDPEDGAALVGRRCIGDNQTTLGQLAFNNCLVNVDAGAWVLGNNTM